MIRVKYSRKNFAKRLKVLARMLEDGQSHSMSLGGKKISIPSDASIEDLIQYERTKPARTMQFQLEWRTRSDLYESITLICEVMGHV